MDNKRTGLIAVVTAIIAFGGSMALTPVEMDEAYYCPLTEQVGIFDRLSDSMKTGYYMEGDVEKRVACRSGNTYDTWIPLREYAEMQGIPLEEVINPVTECDYGSSAIVMGIQGSYECRFDKDIGMKKHSKCYKNNVFSVYAGELLCG